MRLAMFNISLKNIIKLKRLAFSKKFSIEQDAEKTSDLQAALALQESKKGGAGHIASLH